MSTGHTHGRCDSTCPSYAHGCLRCPACDPIPTYVRPLPPVPAPESCQWCGADWCPDWAEHARLNAQCETTWRERSDVDCGLVDGATQTPAVEVTAGMGVRPGQGEGRAPATADRKLQRVADQLAHHLTASADPCQDRGVGWPCDVARVLQAVPRG